MKQTTIRNLKEIAELGLIKLDELERLEKVVNHLPLSVTNQMLQAINPEDPNDPIAKQFIPSANELSLTAEETKDPIGDHLHEKVKGLIHRYPDRCLLTPVHVCPVYCRFCFRKEVVGNSSGTMSDLELEDGFAYIQSHPEIWEVILTGGDPLILKPQRLKMIIERLNAIPHVEIIRIHTRIPVVDSKRINSEMVTALKIKKPVYVLLHANHPNEFTDEAIRACAMLVDAGIPMLSQSVLLKDINDNVDTLSSLMKTFLKNRIKPYYLHHADLAEGTKHFRVSIQKGQELMQALRGKFSGMCQPTYVLDIPGGYGKIPIGPCYINSTNNNYQIEDYLGKLHHYMDSL